MREIKFYRTYSYGGVEGKSIEKRDFETIPLAKQDAINDTTNTDFVLYEVNMIFDGKITESKKYLCDLVCGKDLQNFESKERSKKI